MAEARAICFREYGGAPPVSMLGNSELTMAYVPSHLHHMVRWGGEARGVKGRGGPLLWRQLWRAWLRVTSVLLSRDSAGAGGSGTSVQLGLACAWWAACCAAGAASAEQGGVAKAGDWWGLPDDSSVGPETWPIDKRIHLEIRTKATGTACVASPRAVWLLCLLAAAGV